MIANVVRTLLAMKCGIILLSVFMRAADVTAGIEAGYSNIRQDTVAGPTVLECGSVPTWINGEFGCNPISQVSHDCMLGHATLGPRLVDKGKCHAIKNLIFDVLSFFNL